MNKRKVNLVNIIKYIMLILFIIWINILYLSSSYNIGDLFNSDFLLFNSAIIIIISIFLYSLLNFIFYLLKTKKNKKLLIEGLLSTTAFLFTIFSDLILLGYRGEYVEGLIYFIIVQIIYFLKITMSNYNKRNLLISVIHRLSLFVLLFILINILNMNTILNILVIFYFSNLVFNFIDSIINTIYLFKIKDNRKITYLIFTMGLFLFIMCDITVGIYNLFYVMGEYIWRFYVPSQLLLLISSLTFYNIHIFKGSNNEENNK